MTEKMRQQTKQSSPSLKMMSQLKEIDASRKKIGRVSFINSVSSCINVYNFGSKLLLVICEVFR